MRKLSTISLALLFAFGCKKGEDKKPEGDTTEATKPDVDPDTKPDTEPDTKPDMDMKGYTLIAPADLKWTPLDPSAPDGVNIAAVHGDPMAPGPAAMFLRVPPKGDAGIHTHTSTYRAAVVSGKPKHWLPGEKKVDALSPGAFWLQPGGQAHGDSCEGPEPCVLFIVLDDKFDFMPAPDVKKIAKADMGDYKLVKAKDAKWGPMDPNDKEGPMVAILDGDPATGPVAYEIKLKKDMSAGLHHHSSDYHLVTLAGGSHHWVDGHDGEKDVLEAGTYWFQPADQVHGDTCTNDEGCTAFLFNPKAIDFIPKAK